MGFSKRLGKALPRIAGIILTLIWTCIGTTMAHDDCYKYCYDDCQDYFPGSEFSSCVSANVHCSCTTIKFSIKNPLVICGIILIIALIVFGIFGILFRCVCRTWTDGGVPHHTAMASPAITTTGVGYRNPYDNPYLPNPTSAYSSSFAPSYPVVATTVPVNVPVKGLVQNPSTAFTTTPPVFNKYGQSSQGPYNMLGRY